MKTPDLSRRTIMAFVAVVAGVVVIATAFMSESGPSEASSRAPSPGKAIKPVEPLDPDDRTADNPRKEDLDDSTDPFAASFGSRDRRKLTISVSGNGYVSFKLYYRDRKKPRTVVSSNFTETRNIEGRFPLAAVVMQVLPSNVPGWATRATCTITIDGTEVSQESTNEPWALKACQG